MRLDEAIGQILDSIEEALTNATEEGELLEGVQSIVRGDRARPRPLTPAVWIFAETANPDYTRTSLHEIWTLPIVLTPIIQSEIPEEGYKEATKLAARARSVVLNDRLLGLPDVVRDCKSGRFEPSAPWHNEGKLYSAVAVVTVIFLIKEHC